MAVRMPRSMRRWKVECRSFARGSPTVRAREVLSAQVCRSWSKSYPGTAGGATGDPLRWERADGGPLRGLLASPSSGWYSGGLSESGSDGSVGGPPGGPGGGPGGVQVVVHPSLLGRLTVVQVVVGACEEPLVVVVDVHGGWLMAE